MINLYVNGDGPRIERDPNISALVQSVQEKMRSIVQDTFGPEQPAQNEIKFVSFEEALRELAALKNS